MGQQQLLLLLLVTVLVAIATVIAIDTMQESRRSANEDAVQSDILLIINEAQAYYFRNGFMQGGGRSFDGIGMSDISIGDSTTNGTYTISGSGETLVVEGTGDYEEVFLRATAQFQDGQLEIEWQESE